jgi:hypothetical protein
MEADHEVRLRVVERDSSDIKSSFRRIEEYLQTLTRIEEKQVGFGESVARSFKEIEKLERRLISVEIEIPALKEVRGWIITGVLGVMGLVGIALLALVVGIK